MSQHVTTTWREREVVTADSIAVILSRAAVPDAFGHAASSATCAIAFGVTYAGDPGAGQAHVYADAALTIDTAPGGVTIHTNSPAQLRALATAITRIADELYAAQRLIAEMGDHAMELFPAGGEGDG